MRAKVYPAYCCQECGEPMGYLGRFFEWLLGRDNYKLAHRSWCGRNV